MNDSTWLGNVAYALTLKGLEAAVEHTGGGIYCVYVQLADGTRLCWGIADENWGADHLTDDGELLEPTGGIWIDVSSDSAHLKQVVDSIYDKSVSMGAKVSQLKLQAKGQTK